MPESALFRLAVESSFTRWEASLSAGTRIGLDATSSSAAVLTSQQNWAWRLEQAIERGADQLLSLQFEPGYWLGELEADSTLESDYIYYLHVLGKADPERICQAGELRPAEAAA